MRTETFHTPGPLVVDVQVPAGRVDLVSVDGEETTVELRPLRDNEASREAVEEALVELRDEAGRRRVTVDVERRTIFGFTFEINREIGVRVHAPHGADVVVKVAMADVAATGRFGSGDIKVASGDIGVDRLEGDAKIKSASGDVALRSVTGSAEVQSASGDVAVVEVGGATRVRSASGDVAIREAGADVSVNTASGDVRVESVRQGKVELKSASGDLWIGVREGSRVWVDARSISGDTSSDLDLGGDPAEGDEGPLVEISAASMSGDIRIARAAPKPA
jgi:DUF4097 and DUF4098 domain-containing protein YvlB